MATPPRPPARIHAQPRLPALPLENQDLRDFFTGWFEGEMGMRSSLGGQLAALDRYSRSDRPDPLSWHVVPMHERRHASGIEMPDGALVAARRERQIRTALGRIDRPLFFALRDFYRATRNDPDLIVFGALWPLAVDTTSAVTFARANPRGERHALERLSHRLWTGAGSQADRRAFDLIAQEAIRLLARAHDSFQGALRSVVTQERSA